MEEMVGRWWHEALTRLTQPAHAAAAVRLPDVQKSIGLLFRAAGGPGSLRVAEAGVQRTGGPRHWLHRMAGSGERAALTVLEPDVLALPPVIAAFADPRLNRDLYLWLALLSAHYEHHGRWMLDNRRATARALAAFPGFQTRYRRLCDAHRAQRSDPAGLKGRTALAEHAVRSALAGHGDIGGDFTPVDVAPVWLWVHAGQALAPAARPRDGAQPGDTESRAPSAADAQRRRTQSAQDGSERNAMVLPFRAEALMSWNELVRVNRSTDDEDDGNALRAANDMEQLSVAPDGQTLASRIKFDLDLPSASADDMPLGAGQPFPEWDYKRAMLRPAHCAVQVMVARPGTVFVPTPALRSTARQLRRRLEVLRDAPRLQHGLESGDDIDLDAWVRLHADDQGQGQQRSDTPAVYTRRTRGERSLATLLLADLSLSTDAFASDDARVIDVIRDALYVFGEALGAVGDPFSMWGFSSVRRQNVRMQHLKGFDERWSDVTRARVGAIRPGYYTRMGAAIRHATAQLGPRPEWRRLLMLLTDGKPNDLDVYEGRYGLEDTRHAVHEARAAGLTPFCVTIDATAHDYLPMLFGRHGYAMVNRPQDLVRRLTQAWTALAR
jgi:nitric oxide reductase NorD protein